jgi:hypothetical protein
MIWLIPGLSIVCVAAHRWRGGWWKCFIPAAAALVVRFAITYVDYLTTRE